MAQPAQKVPLMARVAQAARYAISGVTPQTWMSPLQPLQPIAPPDVKGRQFDYPVGLNTRFTPRSGEAYGFRKLRLLAKNCNILRTVIERQKDLIEAFEWQIKPREDQPGHRPAETKFAVPIEQITAFLQVPDKDLDWAQWLRALLEEVFVIDALAIYRRPTADGTQLWGLERIDGSTIFPLIDGSGRRPQSPDPAYQQILKGVPAGDFTRDELLYYPKNPRTNSLYGFSPVEQIIDTVETAIERLRSQKAYFTDGNVGDGMFIGPPSWTVNQIRDWQTYWDDLFVGNLQMRRHGWWVPNGTEFKEIKQPALKDEFDEWLARVICFAFSTSPQPFIKSMNRGNQESQQEVAEEGGIATYMAYIKRLMDRVIREDFGHPELEFAWNDDREFDPQVAAEIDDLALRNGSKTLNEVRDRRGDDPYPSEIGDVALIYTAMGATPVEQAVAPPPEPVAAPAGGVEGASPDGGGNPSGGAAPKPAPKETPAKTKPTLVKRSAADRTVPIDSPKMKTSRAKVQRQVKTVLAKAKNDVAHEVTRQLLILGKADDPTDAAKAQAQAATIAAQVNLDAFDPLAEAVEDTLAGVATEAGAGALVQIGVDDYGQLVKQVGQRALTFARDRSAELVGKRWTADGDLIDNPNPKWAITDGTRTMLRNTIADGLEQNMSVPEIADSIRSSYAFSDERAGVIAETEVARANVQGALEGAREARDAGVKVQKVWLLGQEPCDECLDNSEQGPIDLDDDFESGDDGPPAHPNCVCSLSWDVTDDEDDAEKLALAPRQWIAEVIDA